MRRHVLVAGTVFTIVTAAQMARFLFGWPITIAGMSVPVWASAIAAVGAGVMAAWGLRLYLRTTAQI